MKNLSKGQISPILNPNQFSGERDKLIFFELNASSNSGHPAPPPLRSAEGLHGRRLTEVDLSWT